MSEQDENQPSGETPAVDPETPPSLDAAPPPPPPPFGAGPGTVSPTPPPPPPAGGDLPPPPPPPPGNVGGFGDAPPPPPGAPAYGAVPPPPPADAARSDDAEDDAPAGDADDAPSEESGAAETERDESGEGGEGGEVEGEQGEDVAVDNRPPPPPPVGEPAPLPPPPSADPSFEMTPSSPGYEPEAAQDLPPLAEDETAAPASSGPDSGEVPWQVPNPTPPWPAGIDAPPPPPPPAPPPAPPAHPMGGAPPAPAPPPSPPPAPGPVAPPPAPGPGFPPPGPAGPPPGPAGYPPAPGYPSGPGYQQPGGPVQGPGFQIIDPHAVGYGVNRLGSGGRRLGKVPFVILAAVLEDEDVVEILVSGRFHGLSGAAALVGTKVVIVNEREWKPEIVTLTVSPTMQVQGWQDDRSATLLFADGERQEVVERIPDRLVAIEFAQRVRDRVAQIAAEQAAGQQ